MNINEIAIVIPIYRKPIKTERLSLECLEEVTRGFDKYFIKPYSLEFKRKNIISKNFQDKWFKSKISYGQLLANRLFYDAFTEYKYILIYQLDCLIFNNNFKKWIEMDYDFYCSACIEGEYREYLGKDFVGWGGASIRKVSSCIRILDQLKYNELASIIYNYDINKSGAEDIWWGVEAKEIDPSFKTLPVKDSLLFSFDSSPKPYLLKGGKMPPMLHHGFLFSPSTLIGYYKYLPFKGYKKIIKTAPSLAIISINYVKAKLNIIWREVLNFLTNDLQ